MKARPQKRSLFRDTRGVMIVEFAFVGPMFLLMMLAIAEVGLLLINQTLLNAGARDAARLIRTGHAISNPASVIQNAVCNDMGFIMSFTDCANKILIQVQDFGNYGSLSQSSVSSLSFPSCTTNSTTNGGTPCAVSTSDGDDLIGVRLSYSYQFITPWISACLTGGQCWTGLASKSGGSGSGSTLLIATVIFKNEPF